jgi:hypothetical protein
MVVRIAICAQSSVIVVTAATDCTALIGRGTSYSPGVPVLGSTSRCMPGLVLTTSRLGSSTEPTPPLSSSLCRHDTACIYWLLMDGGFFNSECLCAEMYTGNMPGASLEECVSEAEHSDENAAIHLL